MAFQQGHSKRGPEAYVVQYVEGLSDARTHRCKARLGAPGWVGEMIAIFSIL